MISQNLVLSGGVGLLAKLLKFPLATKINEDAVRGRLLEIECIDCPFWRSTFSEEPRSQDVIRSPGFQTRSRIHGLLELTEPIDTPISPEESSPNIPNIMILGTEGNRSNAGRWSSTTSTLSSYSQGSNHSSSTVTNTGNPEDANLTRLKILILKAAMQVGFSRGTPTTAGPNKSDPPALQQFVKSLPAGAFGPLPSHGTLLTSYRQLVLSDSTFRSAATLPAIGKKASAVDIANSVKWMMRSGQYPFLKDLFRLVFGFHIEEAETRKHITISV